VASTFSGFNLWVFSGAFSDLTSVASTFSGFNFRVFSDFSDINDFFSDLTSRASIFCGFYSGFFSGSGYAIFRDALLGQAARSSITGSGAASRFWG
jgi:hypothetical protein